MNNDIIKLISKIEIRKINRIKKFNQINQKNIFFKI